MPTASPLKGQAPVLVTGPGKGPVSGPVEGPSTGPVIEAVRGSGGKGGPGDVTSGPGDTVETGPDAPRGPDGKPDKTLGP